MTVPAASNAGSDTFTGKARHKGAPATPERASSRPLRAWDTHADRPSRSEPARYGPACPETTGVNDADLDTRIAGRSRASSGRPDLDSRRSTDLRTTLRTTLILDWPPGGVIVALDSVCENWGLDGGSAWIPIRREQRRQARIDRVVSPALDHVGGGWLRHTGP